MSSPLSILSDWNGRVKKKSNERVETTAATMPAVRPPSAAAMTTTITNTSATLAATMLSVRKGTRRPEITRGARPPIARPKAFWLSSGM